MDSTQAQVLIFGSSRANHHYDPRVISEKLEKSCYNTGRDGNFLLFNYAIFKTIILRYKPEIVIFDVDKDFLTHSAEEYERLSSLLPYKGRNRAIEQVIALRGPFEKLKCLSQLYRYNSSLLTIAIGNTEVNKRRKSDIEGYVPLPGTLEMKRPDTDTSAVDPADPQKVSALLDIIMECKKYNIRLVFANSPIFIESINHDNINPVREMAVHNKVEYLDYSTDTVFLNHPEYFADPSHLNSSGASIFSGALADRIMTTVPLPMNYSAHNHNYSN